MHVIRMGSLTMDVGIPSQQYHIEKPEKFVFGLVSVMN